MAGALIPLIATLAPAVIDLIAGLVHQKAPQAEAILGAGTGPVKFAEVFVGVMSDLAKASASGQITGGIPADGTVKMIIQAVVTSMKLSGTLGTVVATVAVPGILAAPQSLILAPGQTITISVAP
jgi:hypothetical protein